VAPSRRISHVTSYHDDLNPIWMMVFITSRAAAESNGGVSALSLKTFSDFSLMGDFLAIASSIIAQLLKSSKQFW